MIESEDDPQSTVPRKSCAIRFSVKSRYDLECKLVLVGQSGLLSEPRPERGRSISALDSPLKERSEYAHIDVIFQTCFLPYLLRNVTLILSKNWLLTLNATAKSSCWQTTLYGERTLFRTSDCGF